MILKTFENFINSYKIDNGELVLQLINAEVIDRETSLSKDFIEKLNKKRDKTLIDKLLPLVNDFNQHKDLDFEDFWNKKKNDYNLTNNIKNLNADKALNKFFKLHSNKLKFNNYVRKSFFDVLGIPKKPKTDSQDIVLPDASRDGSIVTGPEKDNVKMIVKKITQHQNREMY